MITTVILSCSSSSEQNKESQQTATAVVKQEPECNCKVLIVYADSDMPLYHELRKLDQKNALPEEFRFDGMLGIYAYQVLCEDMSRLGLYDNDSCIVSLYPNGKSHDISIMKKRPDADSIKIKYFDARLLCKEHY